MTVVKIAILGQNDLLDLKNMNSQIRKKLIMENKH